jgi:hypothetical protein
MSDAEFAEMKRRAEEAALQLEEERSARRAAERRVQEAALQLEVERSARRTAERRMENEMEARLAAERLNTFNTLCFMGTLTLRARNIRSRINATFDASTLFP